MGQPGFLDLDAGFGQTLLQFLSQLLGDLIRAAAQRRLAVMPVIVGEAAGDAAHGRLRLDLHIACVVLDIEHGHGRVMDSPDHYGGDFHRIAALVIDLERGAVEVVGPQRELARPPLLSGDAHAVVRLRHGSSRRALALARHAAAIRE